MGRPRKKTTVSKEKEVNTSNPTVARTTDEENPQPLADPDTSNMDATNAGTAPSLQNTGIPTESPSIRRDIHLGLALNLQSAARAAREYVRARTAPTLQNTGTPTESETTQGTSPLVRRSPRLNIAPGASPSPQRRSVRLKKISEEDELPTEQTANERNLATGMSTRRSSKLLNKRKAPETGVSSDLAEMKGKASKRKKVASISSPITGRNLKEDEPRSSQLKIGQAEDEQNLGTSSGNADPSADFKSLYEAEKRRADELDAENRKLKDQLNDENRKLGKLNAGKEKSTDSS